MLLIEKIKNKMYSSLNPWFREYVICPYNRLRIKHREVTIFCNNCVGAAMLHDLKLQFYSPFVNLWLYPKDYIKFCENVDHYIKEELRFVPNQYEIYGINYPVAKLDDITIFFQHYHNEKEARYAWERRIKRINRRDIKCILIERDGCTKEDLIRFAKLPYPTAALVHMPMPEMKNTCYIRGFENEGQVGNCIEYKRNHYFGRRYYDDFDYVQFFNTSRV